MFVTIINDCKDDNARGRQESRLASLLQASISFIGVDSDLEAGMQLLDVLDATEGRRGLVLVNVAPRGGHTTKWENGTPFGYFWYRDTLVITSVDGFALSAVKHLGIVTSVELLDTHSSAETMQAAGFITKEAAASIPTTQFRSFDFIPRAGVFMLENQALPSTSYSLETVASLPKAIWHIDNFGNCKTTLTMQDINTKNETLTRFATLPFYQQLRNLPDGKVGLVQGSSGLGEVRFLELMQQRGHFAKHHGAKIGDDVFAEVSHFHTATS